VRYVVTITTQDAIARTEGEFVRNLPPNVHLWRTTVETAD
jgi:hypothetical protein